MDMIKIIHLTKKYGKSRGIEDINLDIKEGEVFGFIGPNGAGKSTTIKCIMNMLNKNNGEILIDNKAVNLKNYKLKQEIGYLPSEIHLYDDLTVEKMIKYSDSFYNNDCMKKATYLVEKLELDTKKKIDELSLGNLKKLGIVLALMHTPKILILDEATSGLDPLMQEVFYQIIKEEKKNGTTIFFSSHNLSEIKKICDRVAIIKEGNIINISNVDEITKTDFNNITIISKDVGKIKTQINSKILNENDKTLKIMYEGDINILIKILSNYNIEKILIEEPSIEEIFMHYYK